MIKTLTITLYLSLICCLLFFCLAVYYFFKYQIINIYKELLIFGKGRISFKNKKEKSITRKQSKPNVDKPLLSASNHTTLMDKSTSLMTTNSSFVIESIEIISDEGSINS